MRLEECGCCGRVLRNVVRMSMKVVGNHFNCRIFPVNVSTGSPGGGLDVLLCFGGLIGLLEFVLSGVLPLCCHFCEDYPGV